MESESGTTFIPLLILWVVFSKFYIQINKHKKKYQPKNELWKVPAGEDNSGESDVKCGPSS